MLPRGYMVGMGPCFASEWGFLATLCMLCFIKTLITPCWCTPIQVFKTLKHFSTFPAQHFCDFDINLKCCAASKNSSYRTCSDSVRYSHLYTAYWSAFPVPGWVVRCRRTGSTTVTHTVKTFVLSDTLKLFRHLVWTDEYFHWVSRMCAAVPAASQSTIKHRRRPETKHHRIWSQNYSIKHSHTDGMCCKTHQEYENDRAVWKFQSQGHYGAQKIKNSSRPLCKMK